MSTETTQPITVGLNVGQRAPDFALPAGSGETVRLSDVLGKSAVVLFFYPKDHSVGCTAEACAFRDSYEVFKQAGAEVVGISTDSTSSHQEFASRHDLPFLLLSDSSGSVRKLYGATALFGLLTGRVTFVIDRQGIIRHSFNSMMNATQHVAEALKVVRELA